MSVTETLICIGFALPMAISSSFSQNLESPNFSVDIHVNNLTPGVTVNACAYGGEWLPTRSFAACDPFDQNTAPPETNGVNTSDRPIRGASPPRAPMNRPHAQGLAPRI